MICGSVIIWSIVGCGSVNGDCIDGTCKGFERVKVTTFPHRQYGFKARACCMSHLLITVTKG